jgi:hypothetical protein
MLVCFVEPATPIIGQERYPHGHVMSHKVDVAHHLAGGLGCHASISIPLPEVSAPRSSPNSKVTPMFVNLTFDGRGDVTSRPVWVSLRWEISISVPEQHVCIRMSPKPVLKMRWA